MTHIERLCRASDKEAAMQVITAIRATLSCQSVTQDDWGKTYPNGYCFNLLFATNDEARAADAVAAAHGVSVLDPSTIATRDNTWA